jgi:hypothetical protein
MKLTSLISTAALIFVAATAAAPHNVVSAADLLLGKRAEHGK